MAMKGGKTHKRRPRKTPEAKITPDVPSMQDRKAACAVQGNESAMDNQLSPNCFLSTPKQGRRRSRQRREAYLTSTPVHRSSTAILSHSEESLPGAKQVDLEYTELITQLKTSEIHSACSKAVSQNRCKRGQVSQRRKGLRTKKTPVRCKLSRQLPHHRNRKTKTDTVTNKPLKRTRSRFQLDKSDSNTQDSSLSSELSIELSHHEEQQPYLNLNEDEDVEEEEEELPSFLGLVDKRPPPITEGTFVWHKFRNFPFWPSFVKRLNRKLKKASILMVDDPMLHTKKGFNVPLKTLKPFECEEANDLMGKAKEKFEATVTWALDFIADYQIRIACGSFSGSFIEYCAHPMSYPVRNKFPQGPSERLTPTSEVVTQEQSNSEEDSVNEPRNEVSRRQKRLLPDRSHAAHNRANEKLVNFIVKQHLVEERLLAVIRGQETSRWLQYFLKARGKRVVNTYLEDEKQLDQVYFYLNELYTTAVDTAPCLIKLESMERVPFVLDVLLPEAIIYAIAGVDNVSVKKAEEKYLRGRTISSREIQQFEFMIERHMQTKSPPAPLRSPTK